MTEVLVLALPLFWDNFAGGSGNGGGLFDNRARFLFYVRRGGHCWGGDGGEALRTLYYEL